MPIPDEAFDFSMHFEFDGEVIFWKGPAPWYFVLMPAEQSSDLKEVSTLVTYGWGVIPVQVRVGGTSWKTSLFPKDGRYLIPVKANIRKAEAIEAGDTVHVQLTVGR